MTGWPWLALTIAQLRLDVDIAEIRRQAGGLDLPAVVDDPPDADRRADEAWDRLMSMVAA